MPYLRFSRDKRGYENTYVVHSDKRRGKSRSRILYWFRTPPGVKVGRAALDEDSIKLIEELNPFVEFDWPRILKGQDAPASEPRVPVEVRRQRREPRSQERRETSDRRETPERREPRERPARSEPPPIAPAAVQDAVPPQPVAAPPEPPAPDVIVAAHARIGADGVARLRTRYVEIVARIAERVTDPIKREELQAQAARLSPDAWTEDADVTRGLDEYEAVFASLREVVGRKRRRRRRGGGGGRADEEAQTNGPEDTSESGEEPEDPGL